MGFSQKAGAMFTWKGWLLSIATIIAVYWAVATIEGTWIRWEKSGPLTTGHVVSQGISAITPIGILGLGWLGVFSVRRARRVRVCPIPSRATSAAESSPANGQQVTA
jgi:hypothetical protein